MKNKNYILIGVSAVVFILFLFWLIASTQSVANLPDFKASSLIAAQNSYDFGNISMANGKVNYEFKIKNNSSEDTIVKKVYTSCMCTEAEIILEDKKLGPFGMPGHRVIPSVNQKIKADGEFVIRAIFDPAAHGPAGLGKMQRQIYIEEDGVKNPLTLNINAFVIP